MPPHSVPDAGVVLLVRAGESRQNRTTQLSGAAAWLILLAWAIIEVLRHTGTDRERLLVVSPGLAEALSAIIARVRGEDVHIPLVSRCDGSERL